MGALLLAAGSRGKRFALPHARIMIHQPLGGVQVRPPTSTFRPARICYAGGAETLLVYHTGSPWKRSSATRIATSS